MTEWSLPILLESLHDDIEHRLSSVRKSFSHPGTKGDGSENVWLDLFNTYLPKRYQSATAHIVDSKGVFSEQIDVVIFDRQYSPFVFNYENQTIIPAESVYAVFEVKQSMNLSMIEYAQKKIEGVRKLHRTSLPIPFANGTYSAKSLELINIIGGILTLESDWTLALGEPLIKQLGTDLDNGLLNIGCSTSHGYFLFDKKDKQFCTYSEKKAATVFLFKLISELQYSGTVPMIDTLAYSNWLN